MRPINTYNYIVPASGTTRGYLISETFDSTPQRFDFRSIELDGLPFIPSGVYIDNSQGIGRLTITITELGYNVIAEAGQIVATQYPAPSAQTVDIVGDGAARLIFVDYPVIPFSTGANDNVAIVNAINALTQTVEDESEASLILLASLESLLTANNAEMSRIYDVTTGYDTDGEYLPAGFDTFPRTISYNGNNDVSTIVVTDGIDTFTQTFDYTGTNLTSISGWVRT